MTEIPAAMKPKVQFLGQDGNVFNLLGKCTKALKRAGMPQQAKELGEKVCKAQSYDEALQLMMQYCDVH